MIPALTADGVLPKGEHPATWEEFRDRFCTSEQRRIIFSRLLPALEHLRDASVTVVWIGGSLVTDRDTPSDFDLCFPVEEPELAKLDPTLLSLKKSAIHARFGGDMFPTHPVGLDFRTFFSRDRDGRPVGTVRLGLNTIP